jgi:hypothetical protein
MGDGIDPFVTEEVVRAEPGGLYDDSPAGAIDDQTHRPAVLESNRDHRLCQHLPF